MKVAPWTIGSVPVDCARCGTVHWVMHDFHGLHGLVGDSCCGERLRHTSNAESPPGAWYAALCSSVASRVRERVVEAVRNA